MSSIYKESNPEEYIRTVNYDAVRNKIAMLIRYGKKPEQNQNVDVRTFHLKLYDVATNRI